jgi:hypothetical protein
VAQEGYGAKSVWHLKAVQRLIRGERLLKRLDHCKGRRDVPLLGVRRLARATGRLDLAFQFERQADLLYQQLPDNWRW